jgi:hypothetical protein
MEVFILLASFVLIGPLALLFGADSRVDDERGWWPGTPRMATPSWSRERHGSRQAVYTDTSATQTDEAPASRRRHWVVSAR